ncbi:hypothetical protein EDD16DRAFT_468227 [Pisolithus croceorrhizus]|nr:hypothetical protein EDD16DRAFT_468227 [Pisolithus croceorrhizus]
MPVLMRLSSPSRTPCHAIEDYSGELQGDQRLRLTTVVMVTVTNVSSRQRCRPLQLSQVSGCVYGVLCWGTLRYGFEVASSGDRDHALGGSLYSPFQGPLELGAQELAWMVALTNLLRNPTLPKAEIHSRLGKELHRLYFDSFRLGMSFCLYRSGNGSRPYLGTRKSTLPRPSPGRSVSSSSKLSKLGRVEEVKDKLFEMFKLNLPYEPSLWYTFGKDLKKHGCAQRTGQVACWDSLQTREPRNPRPEYGGSQLSIRSRRLRSRIYHCSSSLTLDMYGKSTSTHYDHASSASTATRPRPEGTTARTYQGLVLKEEEIGEWVEEGRAGDYGHVLWARRQIGRRLPESGGVRHSGTEHQNGKNLGGTKRGRMRDEPKTKPPHSCSNRCPTCQCASQVPQSHEGMHARRTLHSLREEQRDATIED